MNLDFHHPWVFLLLLPAIAIVVWTTRRKRPAAIIFPTVRRLQGLRPTWRQRLARLIPLLQAVAIVGLVTAAARPRHGDARTVVRRQGIAIQMVLDRSSSMEETVRYEGRERQRIAVVRDVFEKFVAGGDGLQGRRTDLVGLTTFARFTEESCPLVGIHEPLITAARNLETIAPYLDRFGRPVREQGRGVRVRQNPLNATAVGDGLYRAVLSLVAAEEDLARGEDEGGYKIQGKVIILLTDGVNNSGMDPREAGAYAAENGIRVYYIVFREPVEYVRTPLGTAVAREISVDELLGPAREVVEPTGGQAFLASSGDELRRIYEEIDALEKSELGRIEFRSYHERYRWFLIPGVACLFLAFLLSETLLRRIP